MWSAFALTEELSSHPSFLFLILLFAPIHSLSFTLSLSFACSFLELFRLVPMGNFVMECKRIVTMDDLRRTKEITKLNFIGESASGRGDGVQEIEWVREWMRYGWRMKTCYAEAMHLTNQVTWTAATVNALPILRSDLCMLRMKWEQSKRTERTSKSWGKTKKQTWNEERNKKWSTSMRDQTEGEYSPPI